MTQLPFKFLYLFILVVFLRPQELFPPLGILPSLGNIFALGALITQFVPNTSLKLIVKERETKILIGILGCILLTLPFSLWPGGSFEKLTKVFLPVFVSYFLIVGIVDSPEKIAKLIWLIIISVSIHALFGIIDYSQGNNLIAGRLAGRAGSYANPNDFAVALLLPLPLIFFLIQTDKAASKRLILCGLTLFTFAAFVFTYSRTGILALAVSVFAFASKSNKKMRTIFISLLIGIIIICIGSQRIIDRTVSIFDPSKDETGSRQQRIELMKTGFQVFLNRPILGVGFGNFNVAEGDSHGGVGHWKTAHNGLIEVAAELGLFGLLLFLGLLYSIGSSLRQIQKKIAEVDELSNVMFLSVSLEIMLWTFMVTLVFGTTMYDWNFICLLGFSVVIRRWLSEQFQYNS
jgi:O-antigen ligase